MQALRSRGANLATLHGIDAQNRAVTNGKMDGEVLLVVREVCASSNLTYGDLVPSYSEKPLQTCL